MSIRLFFSTLFLLLHWQLAAQSVQSEIQVEELLERGIYLNLQLDFESAYKVLSRIDSTNANTQIYSLSEMHRAHSLLWMFRFDEFLSIKDSLYKFLERRNEHEVLSRVMLLESIEMTHRREFKPAMDALSEYLKQYSFKYEGIPQDELLWKPYLAFLYHFSHTDFEESERLYLKIISQMDEEFPEGTNVARILQLLQSIFYHYQGDFSLSDRIAMDNLRKCEDSPYCVRNLYSFLLSWKAVFKLNRRQCEESLVIAQRALKVASNQYQYGKAIGIIGNSHSCLGDLPKAQTCFEISKKAMLATGVREEYVQVVENYAEFLAEHDRIEEIESLGRELNNLPAKKYTSDYGGNTYIPRILFEHYLEQRDYDKALGYFNLFIVNGKQKVKFKSGWENLNVMDLPIHSSSPNVFFRKASLAYASFLDDQKNSEHLDLALDASMKADTFYTYLISKIFNNESSRSFLTSSAKSYELFIEIATKNYSLYPSEESFNLLYYFIEKSQDVDLLLSKIRKNRKGNLKFDDLAAKSDSMEKMNLDEEDEIEGVLTKIELAQKISVIENPEVFSGALTGIPRIKSLSPEIVYYYNNEHLVILEHTAKNRAVHISEHSINIDSLIEKYRNNLFRPVTIINSNNALEPYHADSLLYKILIEPLQHIDLESEFTVVPSKNLAHIPFDALIYGKRGQLPIIHYSFHNDDFESNFKDRSKENFVSIFKPNFRIIGDTSYSSYSEYRDEYLGQLKYGKVESQSILENFESSIQFEGAQANIENLKDALNHSKIVHLITHAKQNLSDSKKSFIALNKFDSTDEINKVSIENINVLKTDCSLIVLSACETGIGQFIDGIGIESFAKSFMTGGAKSVISSLWAVNDQSTSVIMKYLYENLKKGKRKDEALRQAKLTYLDQADPEYRHPYYWAAFIAVGDMSPIHDPWKNWKIAGVVIILFGGGMAVARSRRRMAA